MSKALNPAFGRLSEINPAVSSRINPSFARLATQDMRLSSAALRLRGTRTILDRASVPSEKKLVYGKLPSSVRIRAIKVAPRTTVNIGVIVPVDAYKLSIKPENLQNISVEQAARVLHTNLEVIQPKTGNSKLGNVASSGNISLRSLLATKAAK